MNIWNFLREVFKQKKEVENEDLNTQIQICAELLVKQSTNKKNLNYSLKSLNIIDKICKSEKAKHNRKNDNECSESEKIASYILVTLKNNYKGEIIWSDAEEQPLFIFQNFKEFYPYKHVKKQIENKEIIVVRQNLKTSFFRVVPIDFTVVLSDFKKVSPLLLCKFHSCLSC